MFDFSPLDNPVWSALTSTHRAMAQSHGLAARYAADVSPLAGLREPSPQAFADLRSLVVAGEAVWLLTDQPLSVPAGWQVLRARVIDQMVCTNLTRSTTVLSLQRLQAADVPDMVALAAATEPGPFLAQTIQMGSYWGVRADSGQLVAMAGQRLMASTFTEISAVCTHAEFRGKGWARSLVELIAQRTQEEGKIPMLHVKTENGAKILYEKMGFSVRRPIQFTVLSAE